MGSRHTYKMDAGVPLWNELVLKTNSITWPFFRKLIEDLWPKLVSSLSETKDINIAVPTDEAWFHIRRACYSDRNEIDVLRLKNGFLSSEDKEKIRLLPEGCKGIIHANWHPWNPDQRHDNAFLSFLQKLSILRTINGICYNKYLGGVSNCYDKCPNCQEAYKVMMTADSKWYVALAPWFDYISATQMDSYRIHEYAHWFGHILSGWPDAT